MTTEDETTTSTSDERAPMSTANTNSTAIAITEADAPTSWIKMKAFGHAGGCKDSKEKNADKNPLQTSRTGASTDYGNLVEVRSNDALMAEEGGGNPNGQPTRATKYKVYKRRFFGFFQLTLLNIIVSWDWLSWSAVSTTASKYYGVSTTAISWLSSSYLFAFVVVCPFTMYVLHRGGPRPAIIIAAVFILLGNWIRYGGTKANNFGAVMFGQILAGVAQPFVLSAPTRYSDLWFSEKGRVTATAVMTLANPFGGALGQLIDPFLSSTEPNSIPNMVLYIAIISSIASLPSFFIPAAPPTPVSRSSAAPKQSLVASLKFLFKSPEFYIIMIPYVVYVGLFNSLSTLINNILFPYGFSENDAGIAGALLIIVGLVTAAVTSPLVDRYKKFVLAMKLAVPVIAVCYFAFIWAPPTSTTTATFVIMSILGAASFSLVPVVLEYLCEITYPVSPEVTSTICWSGGQLLGGIFIMISGALTDGPNGGAGGSTPYNMQRALWFQAVLAVVVVPLPLSLGFFGREKYCRMRRAEAEKSLMTNTTNTATAEGEVAEVVP